MNSVQAQADFLQQNSSLRAHMIAKLLQWVKGNEDLFSAIPWLYLYSRKTPAPPKACLFDPLVSIVLQGQKHVRLGEELFVLNSADFLLTSSHLPVDSHVVEASATQPFLSLVIQLDLAQIRQWILDYDIPAPKTTLTGRGIATGRMTTELLASFSRLLDVLDTPEDIPVISEVILREIVYRLLRSEPGGRLWQTAMAGSQSQRIQELIEWLRHHYAEPLRMEELADRVAMSTSSMHTHFREITSMSPLQFQKKLRLQEARRLMLVENLDAGQASHRVGYESVSQFSREYHRLFGQPPKRDIKLLRSLEQSLNDEAEATHAA